MSSRKKLLNPDVRLRELHVKKNVKRFHARPEDYNLYLNFVLYTALGGLRQADGIMRDHSTKIRRVARRLRDALGVPIRPCWRGLLLEPGEIPPDRLIPPQQEETFFSSWSEDKDVACWFGDRESAMSSSADPRSVTAQRPQVRGYLMEITPKKGDVLFHHSWADRLPTPDGRSSVRLIDFAIRSAPQLAASMVVGGFAIDPANVAGQIAWNLQTQKEVVLRKITRKIKVVPHGEADCPPTQDLDSRLTYPGAQSGGSGFFMVRLNPDVRVRELERRAAAGDLEAQLQLAKQRIRAGTAGDEDVWIALVHDVEQILAPHGWTATPWHWSPPRSLPGHVRRAMDRSLGRMLLSDPQEGTHAELLALFDPLEVEITSGRFLDWIHGRTGPTLADDGFAALVRQVLLPHMEGILL